MNLLFNGLEGSNEEKSLIKSAVCLLIFLQNSMTFERSPNSLTGVLFHWKIKTGGVLIHQ